jgi:hypothetical protein
MTKDGIRWKQIDAEGENLEADSMTKFFTILSEEEFEKVVPLAEIIERLEKIKDSLVKQDLEKLSVGIVELEFDLKQEMGMWEQKNLSQ